MIQINSIYIGNCIDVFKEIDENVVDLTITSPPYDDMREYTNNVINFDYITIINELYRITKPGGVVVWVVGDSTVNGSETGTSFKHALQFKSSGFNIHDTMIYQKTGFNFPSSNRYHQLFEYMFVFSKGKPKTFNPICDEIKLWGGSWGKTRVRKKDGTLSDRNVGNEGCAGIRGNYGYKKRSNIWKITNSRGFGQKDKIAYEHPATFPEKLAEDHIISWSNPGDLVLDPMCGSGTVCKYACILRRNYIGIDISEKYCEIAKKQLGSVETKLNL